MAIGNNDLKLYAGLITSVKIAANVAGLSGDVIAGYTGDDVSLSSTIETSDMTCGQQTTPVSTSFKSIKFQLKFSFAEYKLINMAYGLGTAKANAGAVSADTYLSGSTTGPDEVCIQVVFSNPLDTGLTTYTLTCYKCRLASGGTVSFTKGSQGFIEVTFDVLANSGLPYSIAKTT
jgi:hypothetical protein